jgi:uncharacterized protein
MLPAMRISPTIGLFVFAAVVFLISAATVAYVVPWIGRRLRREKEPQRSGLAKWTRRDVLGLAGGGLACIAWGFFEPYRLNVTRTPIVTSKLPGAQRPVRIVHISDLHCDPKVRCERKLPGVIADLSPDLIVYTGDSINSAEGLPNFRRCMTEIAKIAPTFASQGNWDLKFGHLDLFGETGVTELNGASQRIDVAGTHLWVAGAKVMNMFSMNESTAVLHNALAKIPYEDFKCFLYHYPDLVFSLAEREVDLHCAGHTHGGQVAMPFYGGLVTVSKYGKQFEAGLYKPTPDTHLYVNRGIGMEGGRAPRVRFWCPPEVSLIELIQKDTATTRQA